jgi:hypothetical protein
MLDAFSICFFKMCSICRIRFNDRLQSNVYADPVCSFLAVQYIYGT